MPQSHPSNTVKSCIVSIVAVLFIIACNVSGFGQTFDSGIEFEELGRELYPNELKPEIIDTLKDCIVKYHLKNGKGRMDFTQYYLSGKIAVTGQYIEPRKITKDFLYMNNPDGKYVKFTFEYYTPIKDGKWLYYSGNDSLIKVEKYEKGKLLYSNSQSRIITPGIGIKGIIEISKTEKENEITIGKGKKIKEKVVHSCIKPDWWEHYIKYDNCGIKAYINRYDQRKNIEKKINYLEFDSTFIGGLPDGISMKKTTRKQVYEKYGFQKYNNPGIEYPELGIGFLFNNTDVVGNLEDLLIEIDVFAPRPEKK
jgi:hypothetical protein